MDTAERFERAVKPTSKALDAVLSLIDRAKETSVPLKGSVWEVATGRIVGLESFESSARDLKRELDEWQEESATLERSLRELESAIESGGTTEGDGSGEESEDAAEDRDADADADVHVDVDYDHITEEFSEAMRSMEALDEKSARLENRLREASEKSHRIAERADGVPVLGGDIKRRFETLSTRLSETADEVVRMNRKPSDVLEVYPGLDRGS